MGNCGCAPKRKEVATINAIIDCLMRVRLTCEQYQLRQQRTLKMQEDLLLQVLSQETSKRSRMTEKAMIGRTVFAKNMLRSTCRAIQSITYSKWRPRHCSIAKHSWKAIKITNNFYHPSTSSSTAQLFYLNNP